MVAPVKLASRSAAGKILRIPQLARQIGLERLEIVVDKSMRGDNCAGAANQDFSMSRCFEVVCSPPGT